MFVDGKAESYEKFGPLLPAPGVAPKTMRDVFNVLVCKVLVTNELTLRPCRYKIGVLIVRGPGVYILPDCKTIELAVKLDVKIAPV